MSPFIKLARCTIRQFLWHILRPVYPYCNALSIILDSNIWQLARIMMTQLFSSHLNITWWYSTIIWLVLSEKITYFRCDDLWIVLNVFVVFLLLSVFVIEDWLPGWGTWRLGSLVARCSTRNHWWVIKSSLIKIYSEVIFVKWIPFFC